ncbi:peptidase M1 [Mucilaginibacter sp. PPCGB 2223]|nr:peptidase M1 [Mucilaginibacter sp. PPCGB 2223]
MFWGATLLLSVCQLAANAQQQKPDDPLMKIYRATAPKINDLVHTKLAVRFDYKKRYMYGKEWVTLKPRAYATDSLRLDAKGMDIHNISIVKGGKNYPLKFSYDSLSLAITLDKKYLPNENYTVYIDYTSKPDELKVQGSAAINDAKGLYFINPDGADKDKPIQIWTQGETEASSAWFPTIDKPNQKTTEEIAMTVPAKYVTLSNGKLVSQKPAGNGLRTDTWKMDLPHSPYLFMMAVGDFKIYKDKWHNKEVSYYLEPKYAPYAKDIFGFTPEAMAFYSKILGIEYPWNKYSQIVVRDYVSGAMENTTATLHGQQVQATRHELVDGKPESETDIVHELFHQWFGDYVTTESWSNITVNESFADLSETLWAEYKHGKDAGDEVNYQAMQKYLRPAGNKTKNLVRFYYHDKEDVFDAVTYEKGGRILNMLRNYLGNEVFFKGLHIYLTQNAFGNGEAQQLRLALEQASGQDLNWYFNQWYYGPGHPELKIDYKWDAASHTQTVYVQQTQQANAFTLPIAVDIYAGGKKTRHKVWLRNRADTLTFTSDSKPDLVNVDGDKILLCQKTDNKTLEEYVFQYSNAPLFLDRLEAINMAATHQDNDGAQKVMLAALKDKYFNLRIRAINAINLSNADVRSAALPVLTEIIKSDPKTLVRAAAINVLVKLNDQNNVPLFKAAINSPSYAVQGAALNGIAAFEPDNALKIAKNLEADNGGALTAAITKLYMTHGGEAEFPFIAKSFRNAGVQQKFNTIPDYVKLLVKINNPKLVTEGVTDLKETGIRYKAFGAATYISGQLEGLRTQKEEQAKSATGTQQQQLQQLVKYIGDCIDELGKK